MFTGLNAFPLTPVDEDRVHEESFGVLMDRLVAAEVDEITALGSTGSYVYLTREQRSSVTARAVEHAAGIPVVVGIGSLRTSDVLALADDAQEAGASGLLLAPVSYQALTADDVYTLFDDVTARISIPLAVYDNPGTTHFTFTDDLYESIAGLPHVASIKIPGVPGEITEVEERITHLRRILPDGVTVGVSGDAFAAAGLMAGCDTWYSVIGGTLPLPAMAMTRAAQSGNVDHVLEISHRLQPLWDLFAKHGSLRVVAAIAEYMDLVPEHCLPRPILGLDSSARQRVAQICDDLSSPTFE